MFTQTHNTNNSRARLVWGGAPVTSCPRLVWGGSPATSRARLVWGG